MPKPPKMRWNEREQAWMSKVTFPDGHRETVKRKNRDDAQADLDQILARRAANDPKPDKVGGATFDDVITAWIGAGCPNPGGRSTNGKPRARVKRDKDANTIERNASLLRTHVAPRRDLDDDEQKARRKREPNAKAISALWVDRTTTERVEEIFEEMAREGLGSATIYRTWKELDTALAWGVRHRKIKRNPADECLLPEGKPQKDGKPLTLAEAQAFLSAAARHPLYALWITAVFVGNRPGELTGIRWPHIDLDSDEPSLDIAERAKYVKGKYVGQAKPKTGREGAIGLHNFAVAALRRHRSEMMMLGLYEPEGFVFPTENGRPHLQGNIRKYLRKVCKAADIDHERTTYDLRRTFASIADEYLGNRVSIGKVMGHSGRNAERTTAGYISGVRPVISHAVTAFDAFIAELAS